ncbi:M10 family metallopeptidase C-terminal domain-containing protein [Vannielia litorea]|uniref:M10 family metallopeptidase C-terminal domain-containing protein n=1 Tax=Vannielia litorea TaxID=1217970 RepID=UPI001C969882|nr:M10 family metallopeptidase C-terminal domain-containing protein [Vannielia litorea]MBY6046701.1 M10 family metallopeptidase C-terminal domain-containing protein [Vannielia litorea]MBY6074115.1 M10 family metallopeptidase C-terminal domain-containing protein [Vannielia litorea]
MATIDINFTINTDAATVDADHFGVNLLYRDEEFADVDGGVIESLEALGTTTLRWPGGGITESDFTMDAYDIVFMEKFSGHADQNGDGVTVLSLSNFLATASQVGGAASIVIPTIDGFGVRAGEALLSGVYGERTVSEAYLELVSDYVMTVLELADSHGVHIKTFEIGNEFWLGGQMTAEEYGRLAAETAQVVDEAISSFEPTNGSQETGIIVQSTHCAGKFSPKVASKIWVNPNDPDQLSSVEVPGFTEIEIPGQGNARVQLEALIEQLNAYVSPEGTGASEVITGIVDHYYEDTGLEGVDNGDYSLYMLSLWEELLDRPVDLPQLEFHITEWNARANARFEDNRGLAQASMIVEQFYEMIVNGVDAAQIWPLRHEWSVEDTALTGYDVGGLRIAGEAFAMMSESLTGTSAIGDFEAFGVDVHAFGTVDLDWVVLFASDRTGEGVTDFELALEDLNSGDRYFVVATSLGVSEGQDPMSSQSDPDIEYTNGYTSTIEAVQIDLDAWELARVEMAVVNNEKNVIQSYDGNDYIAVYGGDDIVSSGAGDDYVTGGAGNDILHGGEGEDTLLGGSDNDLIDGELGNDVLDGGVGHDTIWGGEGNDDITGHHGHDLIFGNDGDDAISGGEGNDQLLGGLGADRIHGDEGSDHLDGGFDNDFANGGAGDDIVFGRMGDDQLRGGEGSDIIDGGEGSDILIGGDWNPGDDHWAGDSAADVFVFNDVEDSLAGSERDLIRDFETGIDQIDLSGIDAIAGIADSEFVFVGSDAFSGVAGELRVDSFSWGSIVSADVDGDGVADMQIKLQGADYVSVDDFIL